MGVLNVQRCKFSWPSWMKFSGGRFKKTNKKRKHKKITRRYRK